MKKFIVVLALVSAFSAQAGIVRFGAKATAQSAKFGVKAAKKSIHVARKVIW